MAVTLFLGPHAPMMALLAPVLGLEYCFNFTSTNKGLSPDPCHST